MAGVRLVAREVSARTATFVVWGVLAGAAVALQAVATTTHRIPTIGQVIRSVVRNPVVRAVSLVAWLWVGWHVFVRSSR
jgi:hypothetical protein